MPKMFQHRIIFLIIFFPLFLFAQSIALKTDILPEKNTDHSFRLTLQFRTTPQIVQGIALRFSQKERVFPEKILVNGQSVWLKQSRKIPQKDNVVHWFYADSLLELRFNNRWLKSGASLVLNLHLNELQATQKNLVVGLLPLNASAGNNTFLAQKAIPLPKNPQK